MRIRDLMQVRMVSDPQISSDGRRIAFVHTEADYEENEYVASIWMADVASGKHAQFTFGRGKDNYPRWSPDSSRLLFTSTPPKNSNEKQEKRPQLYTIDVSGGEARQVTDLEGGAKNPRWSPDGAKILFTSLVDEEEKAKTDVKVVRRILYRFNGRGYFVGKRNHLFIASLRGGHPTQTTRGEFDVELAEWLSNGRVAFISNVKPDADLTGDKYIYSIKPGNDEPEQLTDGPRFISSLRSSPKQDEIAYVGHDYRVGLATKKDVWVLPETGGKSVSLTRGFDQDIGNNMSCDIRVTSPDSSPMWSQDGKSLFFNSVCSGVAGLYEVQRDGGEVQRIIGEPDHGVEAWSVAKDDTVAYTVLRTTAPMELWVLQEGKRRQVTYLNRQWMKRINTSDHERFSFRSSGGHEVEGWLLLPPGYEKNRRKKCPLLLQIHGGPRMAFGYAMMHEFQVLAAQGWAVMYVNPYGSGGYSEAYQAGLPGHYGEQDYADLMQAVDYATKQYDFIDAKRLGVLGGSYGGYMTNWIVTHTDRFRVAVTMRSISNWVSMFGCSDIGWNFCKWEMGGVVPWENEEAYMAKSPIRYVGNARTPTLIIHSEEDYRCLIEQAEQFHTALRLKGVPTALVRFPGENHDLSREGKPKHREERLNRIVEWIREYI
jgi:dipeptidyl aminopeptidase/acylaminoacyl peptidase